MLKHILFLAVTFACCPARPFVLASAGDSTTNEPTKVTFNQLLKNKEQFDSKKVEVTGYYYSNFEYSCLMEDDRSANKVIWIDPFRLAPGCKVNIPPGERGSVRIIGVFESREGQSYGHLGMSSAQITRVELFQKVPDSAITNVPSHSPKATGTYRAEKVPPKKGP